MEKFLLQCETPFSCAKPNHFDSISWSSLAREDAKRTTPAHNTFPPVFPLIDQTSQFGPGNRGSVWRRRPIPREWEWNCHLHKVYSFTLCAWRFCGFFFSSVGYFCHIFKRPRVGPEACAVSSPQTQTHTQCSDRFGVPPRPHTISSSSNRQQISHNFHYHPESWGGVCATREATSTTTTYHHHHLFSSLPSAWLNGNKESAGALASLPCTNGRGLCYLIFSSFALECVKCAWDRRRKVFLWWLIACQPNPIRTPMRNEGSQSSLRESIVWEETNPSTWKSTWSLQAFINAKLWSS